MKKKYLDLLVAGTLLCSALMGCTKTYATDFMDGVKAGTPTEVQVQEETWAGMYDFSVKLLQSTCEEEENTLVSPMSVLSALAMTANGARGETSGLRREDVSPPIQISCKSMQTTIVRGCLRLPLTRPPSPISIGG